MLVTLLPQELYFPTDAGILVQDPLSRDMIGDLCKNNKKIGSAP